MSTGKETVLVFKSQGNPRYLNFEPKSWPFFEMGCHGMPKGLVTQKTEDRSYAKVGGSCEIGERNTTKLSTHLKTGWMALQRRISMQVSATIPWMPPAGANPSTVLC